MTTRVRIRKLGSKSDRGWWLCPHASNRAESLTPPSPSPRAFEGPEVGFAPPAYDDDAEISREQQKAQQQAEHAIAEAEEVARSAAALKPAWIKTALQHNGHNPKDAFSWLCQDENRELCRDIEAATAGGRGEGEAEEREERRSKPFTFGATAEVAAAEVEAAAAKLGEGQSAVVAGPKAIEEAPRISPFVSSRSSPEKFGSSTAEAETKTTAATPPSSTSSPLDLVVFLFPGRAARHRGAAKTLACLRRLCASPEAAEAAGVAHPGHASAAHSSSLHGRVRVTVVLESSLEHVRQTELRKLLVKSTGRWGGGEA